MRISRHLVLVVLFAAVSIAALAAELPLSQRAANAAIARWPNGRAVPEGGKFIWNYELGTLLLGMDAVWQNTTDPRYFNYVKASVDQFVQADGTIATLRPEEQQLDNVLMGRMCLRLYGVTGQRKYLTAATFLYDAIQKQPRNAEGGLWHKQRYPNQMWLDGLYMAQPFYAEYSAISHHPENFKDITHQFVLVEQHTRDAKTGLLYHGWDQSKQEKWANKQTGDSPEFWSRAMGWYMMAIVDILSYYPEGDPGRKELLAILDREAAAVAKYQDPRTGLWYDIMDKPAAKGNYFESSAACMFAYAYAKGVRMGYLPERYSRVAENAYKGIVGRFIKTDGDDVSLTETVKASGLGGDPYRDGSLEYYFSEKRITNDQKGVGAFILASTEFENMQNVRLGRGKTVMMDAWFNSQRRTDAFGQQIYYHYKWDDWTPAGYSLFGRIFENDGAHLATLYTEPTAAALAKAQVYMIVSPDNKDKNPNPHYAVAKDADEIASWVKAGGVLVIMQNDTSFADLDHFNVISEKFGIHFNGILRKHVEGTKWEMGKISVDGSGPIFHHPHTIYVKDVCTITASGQAKAIMTENGDVFMATAKFGKGTVLAFVDPWLYNEYTDGRKLPAEYDNYAGGVEFARWILEQAGK